MPRLWLDIWAPRGVSIALNCFVGHRVCQLTNFGTGEIAWADATDLRCNGCQICFSLTFVTFDKNEVLGAINVVEARCNNP